MSLARVLQTLKIKYPIRDQLLWRPTVPGRLIQCCYAKGGAALRSMHGKEVLNGRLYIGGEKGVCMHTFLIVLLIWVTPSFLFVGWRLWMSRPIRDVHYRHRWEYSHRLFHPTYK